MRTATVSEVSPSKSPAAMVRTRLSDSVPVMAARWASVTRAQLLTAEILPRIAVCTSAVRPQMPPTTVTLAVSVPGAEPFVPPRPVTVRVKVSLVPAASAGIVTTGVALVASSNVTPPVGPEVCLQE